MSEAIPLNEFATSLRCHDWWHQMSDDGAVWDRGESRERDLRAISRQSDKHARLFDLAEKYHRNPNDMEHDDGLNWARAFLAVSGIRASDEEIADVIEPKGSRLHDRQSDGMIHWFLIDERIAEDSRRP